MRKMVGIFLILMVLLSSAAQAEGFSFTPGTYTGSAWGMYGTVSVNVTVSENRIESVEADVSSDTPVIANAAASEMPAKIVDAQSLGVDTVTGATFTSGAIRQAAKNALKDVCSDFDALCAEYAVQQVPHEDETYDVVIVGAGGAGLGAASQIGRTSGLKVLVLEKTAILGGTTALSGGAFTVSHTSLNEASGIDFTPEQYVKYFVQKAASRQDNTENMSVNETLLYQIGERADKLGNLFIENGFPVSGMFGITGHYEDEGTGNTALLGSAYEMWGKWLPEFAKKCGAEIRTNSRVVSLLADGNNVTGVKVETPESTYNVYAKKVILATGGFGADTKKFKELNSSIQGIDYIWSSSAGGCTGDAFDMLSELDPAYTGYGVIYALGNQYNYGMDSAIGGVPNFYSIAMINKDGEALENTTGKWYYERGIWTARQPEGFCWTIVDSNSVTDEKTSTLDHAMNKATLELLEQRKQVLSADTLEELAEKIGIPADKLTSACAQANSEAENGITALGIPTPCRVEAGPFYALKTYANSLCTMYGLKLDDKMHVVKQDGSVIGNLFAAGEVVMGNFFFENYLASGNAVAISVYGGTYAADNAIAEISAE